MSKVLELARKTVRVKTYRLIAICIRFEKHLSTAYSMSVDCYPLRNE
jgi:hypothetical protein